MKNYDAYENLGNVLEENIPFFIEFARKNPQFYGRPLLDEREGAAFVEALHQEYRRSGITDPLSDITLNIMEDAFIAPRQNVVIYKIPAYMPATMHYTDYFEVKYIRSGTCTYYSEHAKISLTAGDLIIVPPKVRQCMVINDSNQVFNILIRASTFDTAFLNLVNQDDFLAEFFSRALYGIPADYLLWHCGGNDTLHRTVNRCYREFHSKQPYKDRMVDILVMELFVELLRMEITAKTLPEIPSPTAHETIRILIGYLQNHCADASLASVAAICNYSERQLARIIREELDCSFSRLRQQIRLKKACSMLKNPSLKLKDISKSLGFANESYFCKVFREEYHITPMEYREQSLGSLP